MNTILQKKLLKIYLTKRQMLAYTEKSTHETSYGAYSFGLFAGFRHKNALYSQILSGAGLHSGDVVLEISCADEEFPRITAKLNLVENGPLGGLPGMQEVISVETGFGKNSRASEELPWANGTFETIVCIGIFNHIADQEGVITRLRRLLSPTGRLIIADQWFRKAGPMFADLLQPYSRNSDFRIYSPALVSRLLKKSGFDLVETRAAGTTNFLCTATIKP